MRLVERKSGLVVPETPPEPPKPRKVHTAQILRHDDLLDALKSIERHGADLVIVGRSLELSGVLLPRQGYVVVYQHTAALSFTERC